MQPNLGDVKPSVTYLWDDGQFLPEFMQPNLGDVKPSVTYLWDDGQFLPEFMQPNLGDVKPIDPDLPGGFGQAKQSSEERTLTSSRSAHNSNLKTEKSFI